MKMQVTASFMLIFTLGWFLPGYTAPPEDYYEHAVGKTGQELKHALHEIIDGHTPLPYTKKGNSNWLDGEDLDVWEALVYTDSACPDSEPQCGLIQLLYLDEVRSIDQANRGNGSEDSWDREHVYPKSRGFPKKGQDGYTDLHHLRPADRDLNGSHSNYGYDNGGTRVVDKRGDDNDDANDVVTEARLDTENESFEPTDRAKGQVARMIFYMDVRYEVGDDGPGEGMPDLTIRDTNSRTKEPWIGDLCTLLDWHNQFSVTAFEARRNDRVMELQGNRNPFIDHPEWVNSIWGNDCSEQ